MKMTLCQTAPLSRGLIAQQFGRFLRDYDYENCIPGCTYVRYGPSAASALPARALLISVLRQDRREGAEGLRVVGRYCTDGAEVEEEKTNRIKIAGGPETHCGDRTEYGDKD
ncbi:hypothetical protein THAOC_20145 [Thalassiosira oceanica]|uniref:Uncharacterized protein n=1 Tax=Thalassiosira oceanica TaxID=159749 RepID=K0S0L0_THAOC|nr:hypothetical protein THAOC_20145 [Thalassiosira oceanica]|eukprot:EJK59603.1 hypothetical protein THAOC_20145 [Thalassiosira oceanica]